MTRNDQIFVRTSLGAVLLLASSAFMAEFDHLASAIALLALGLALVVVAGTVFFMEGR